MEKLEKANLLKEQIDRLEDFIGLIVNGQKFDKNYQKQNELSGLTLSAHIWTGSDNPRYEKGIREKEVITAFVNGGLSILQDTLKLKKEEFDKIFF